jgi:CubicO group peptidase (beta-lactamase class C family)
MQAPAGAVRSAVPLRRTTRTPNTEYPMLTRRFCLALLLFGALVPALPARAQDYSAPLAAIEKAIDFRRKQLHVPGAALVIVKDDKVIYLKGLGLRDLERMLPVTPDTLFAVGSTTKAFTAATVLMSADDGKLELSDPPSKYLPYFKLRDPEANAKITISDLLCHRSGLERTDLLWYTGVLGPEHVLRAVSLAKPTAKLGEKWQYQNVMYLAAGQIVAKVQEESWEKFLARRIFKPLGMRATTTSVDVMERSPDHALGYDFNEDRKEYVHLPMRRVPNIAPAGAINSNVREMGQWLRLLLNGGTFEGKRLISEASFKEFWTKRITIGGPVGYGYGWMLRSWNGHPVMEHGGNIDGFNAQVALMPDQKLGLVLLTNVSASPLGTTAMNVVWQNLVGAPKDAAPAAAAAAPGGDPAKEAGTYRLKEANLDFVVRLKDGKLTVQPSGQPEMPLQSLGGRRYKVGPPAPEGVFLTFRQAANPAETEALFEQGGAQYVMPRTGITPPYKAPITVEELMARVVQALGGEEALRREKSLVVRYTLAMETQGLTGETTEYRRAPNLSADVTRLYALGRKLAETREYFDGTTGGQEASFAGAERKSGKEIAEALLASDFYPELNWRKLYKTVDITGTAKVGDEEAYVVEKKPETGSPVKEYVSTRSFLVLKRERMSNGPGGSVPTTEVFSDYRAVDGVLRPFKRVQTSPAQGETVITVKEIRVNRKIGDEVFRARTAQDNATKPGP